MSTVVALGSAHELDGFALAGVRVLPLTTPGEVAAAWAGLPDDVSLVLLTAEAADTLAGALGDRPDVLTAVLP